MKTAILNPRDPNRQARLEWVLDVMSRPLQTLPDLIRRKATK